MSRINEHLARIIRVIHGRLIMACCICCAVAPIHSAFSETTLRDVYSIAGNVRPVVGIRAGQKWVNTPFNLSLGLERNSRSRKDDISSFNVVVDAAGLSGRIPSGCVRRFSVPWRVVKMRFPISRDSGSNDYPETKYDGSFQVYHLNSVGCSITLLVGHLTGYSSLNEIVRQYPGLTLTKTIDLLQEGEVEFDDGYQKTSIKFVFKGE